jgi:uncharacterized sporulation protein YeaH/YhbH (DUF444 family)
MRRRKMTERVIIRRRKIIMRRRRRSAEEGEGERRRKWSRRMRSRISSSLADKVRKSGKIYFFYRRQSNGW